ncbi:pentatricopeptide repeat-containing protein At5g66520-like [Tripterygium wilfordii]|uniref:pentatricopeptide repeat-containing protein At5g66520-like n=1 Tax=Tripterygium wilfordii TaxID=458696 RepID=UPI0018F7F82B|nr:pentatricopeptide repeat-containing protein At5g66520-like [Tripterygium wilfordii]XP_038687269.1 pentatricopeptide repeat-containing protein At5g66520-like [Tripterygium wilfordii]
MFVEEPIPVNRTGSRAIQQNLFSLLQSCNCIKNINQIHNQVIVNGFSQKSFLVVKLLSFYVASDHLVLAQRIFQNIQFPSTTIWNQMIRCYVRRGEPQKSVQTYNEMVAAGCEPDGFTYSFVLSVCARSRLLREGEQVHAKVLANGYCSNVFVRTNLVNLYAINGYDGIEYAHQVFDEMGERNVVTWNSMLSGYIRHGDVDGARRIFDEMPERNIVSWTTMIAGCAQHGKCRQGLSLFNEIRRAGVGLDQVALLSALSACAELGDLRLGKWIHSYVEQRMHRGKQPIPVSLNNALLHMYASCGVIEEASKVFREMEQRNTVSWTTMIAGFAKQGFAREALTTFHWMQSLGSNEVRPDEITFIGVLSACSHAGLVDEGRQIFNHMNLCWGIKPRIEHYCCMVDLLSRAGFLDEAHNLIQSMPMKPNDAIWGALLGGCRIHKSSDLTSHVAQKLEVECDPDRAAGYLVLLSNIYATDRRWLDVSQVREKMVELGVRKPPGRSWVQINGVLHDFIAGDSTHKHASSIYNMLGRLTRQISWEGHQSDISETYKDVVN